MDGALSELRPYTETWELLWQIGKRLPEAYSDLLGAAVEGEDIVPLCKRALAFLSQAEAEANAKPPRSRTPQERVLARRRGRGR